MSHFGVLVLHRGNNIDSLMAKYSCEATEDDGGEIEFVQNSTIEEAKEEYSLYIAEHPEEIEEYPDYDTFAREYNGYKFDEEENSYGYVENSLSLYDWCEVGGRWDDTLPTTDEETKKKLLKKALNPSLKEVQKKYKDNLPELIRLAELPEDIACVELKIGTGHTLEIGSKNITSEDIGSFWYNMVSSWNIEGINKEEITCEYCFKRLFERFIVSVEEDEQAYQTEEIELSFFTEMFEKYKILNDEMSEEEIEDDGKYRLTVVDCHT